MSDSHGEGGGGWPLKGVADSFGHKLHDAGYHVSARPFVLGFFVLNIAFLFLAPIQTLRNWLFLGFFAPIWMPLILSEYTFAQWVRAKRAEFIASQQTILLELRMPRDTQKTPLAMETIFANFHITSGESNSYAKYWQGKVRTWFSIEIVSIGGRVRFYMWTRAGLRRGIESAFYAQYPDMEIVEAEDYSLLYDPADSSKNDMLGEEFALTKPDPYPIKTYVDFKLDQAGAKPEEIVDPMAQMIELFGSLGPKEQLWFQIIFRATKPGEGKYAEKGPKHDWKIEGRTLIEEIRDSTAKKGTYTDPTTGKVSETQGFPNPTKGQMDTMTAIERSIGKQGFDVGMRAIYSAPKENYHGTMIPFVFGTMLKSYSNDSLNGFKVAGLYDMMYNDYPWEDPDNHHKEHSHQTIVEYYRRRAYFHDPYVGPWMILTTEELATLFHVPSASISTPSLPRIQSTTGGAPSNLPT
jgi:hypothetical protein